MGLVGRLYNWLETAFPFEKGAIRAKGRIRLLLVRLLCLLVGGATVISLMGWMLAGMDGLRLLSGSSYPAMKFATACMLLALSLLAWRLQELGNWSPRQVFILAGGVLLLALGQLFHLFPAAPGPDEIRWYSRTTEGTGLICACLALSVLTSRAAHYWISALLAALAGAIAYAILLAYVASGGVYLAEAGSFALISPQTALAAFALAVAIGLCGSSGFIDRLWRYRSSGRFLISLGFPFIYTLPLVLAWLIGQGEVHMNGRGYLIPLLLTLFTFILAATKLFSALQIYHSERGMRQMLEQAEALARAKSDFLANMSHEVRTPLNAILGLTRLFRLNTPLNPKQEHYVDKIERASDLLLNIVSDILDFSRLESGGVKLEDRPFELDGVFAGVQEMFAAPAEAKGLSLEVEIGDEVPQGLSGDSLRLSQILINLIGNALKFTEKGRVRLEVSLQGRTPGGVELAFVVRDTGIGISPAVQGKLFDSFFQEDSSTTRRFGGSGLGLVICKRLVEMMDGRIWVESTPGFGSAFHFTCRFGLSPVADAGKEGAAYRRHVLVADDEPISRLLLVRQLKKLGHEVEEADGGERALALAQERDFDVLFLDWRMPDLDGIQVAVRLRAEFSRRRQEKAMPHVVLVSGAEEADVSHCAEAEGLALAGYMAKPVTAKALRQIFTRIFSPLSKVVGTQPHDIWQRRGLRVLLVEDNPFNQEVMRETLALIKARVVVANHGREALDCLQRQAFDLVLMDVQMPVMDGLEATRAIRTQPRLKTLPIIGLTANALPGDREACLEAGMNEYLAKPVNLEVLLNAIHQLVSPVAARAENFQPGSLTPLPDGGPGTQPLVQLFDCLGSLSCLDVKPALERVRNNHAQYVKLLKLFLEQGRAIMEDLEQAARCSNLEALRGQAHALKGSAGLMGVIHVHARAAALEDQLRQEGAAASQPNLAALGESWQQFCEQVMPLLEQAHQRH